MSDSQSSLGAQSWKDFLPARAFIMARLRPTPAPQARNPLELSACESCRLCQKRTQIVFGEGNPRAQILFIGDAPGEHEDRGGRPFLGKSGELLDRMIQAIGLSRSDTYMTTLVKCRPPEDRNPEPDEILACAPHLHNQIEHIRPALVITLGQSAAQTLLQAPYPLSELRGRFHRYRETALLPTFHPSELLQNPALKKLAWADLQEAAKHLGIQLPISKAPTSGR
jgi:DNA polymerase